MRQSPRRPRHLAYASAALLCLGLPACSKKPVLYPNATYYDRGPEGAEFDIDQCRDWADAAGAGTGRAGRLAGGTATGAATGAAAGAAAGAIRGGGAGIGAATGAAAAGAGSLVRGLFRWREPDAVERRFVEMCLRERGYQPIGWR